MLTVDLCYGIDVGTSGARAIAIDPSGMIQAEVRHPFPPAAATQPQAWLTALEALFQQTPVAIRQQLQAIAINGTSSTLLLCDATGNPVTAPLMYNDRRGAAGLPTLQAIAPADHVVLSASSSLAKLLWWRDSGQCDRGQNLYLLHQADWLTYQLDGQLGHSDYHNALKLGYDVVALQYPDWLLALDLPVQLPQVHTPGAVIGTIRGDRVAQWQLPPTCKICAGTTDSIAAFWASGAQQPGEAVTSLGSTLVLKLLSKTPVNLATAGIYSHRWGDWWLVGGASNTGGAVLQALFTPTELRELSDRLDPTQPSPYAYYPLLQPGERFPVNDPHLEPCLTPRPADPAEFLHGLLDSMARIEQQGYARLANQGASPIQRVYTAGGGAQNQAWTAMRQRRLGVPVTRSPYTEAAYGTACLAQLGSG